jgi:eukaryotic-like serine/threonine-protein kinase
MSSGMPDASTVLAGRYRLGELLGGGGMGRVWLARDETLERDVAIKEILLPPVLSDDDRAAAHRRTLREARAAARLSHPHVVQVYDVLDADDRTWIVMEYVPARTLQQAIKADGPLDPRRAARIGLDLLGALTAAHRSGVDHRDVKPANVLLADDGRVLLTDFGIATVEGDVQTSSADLVIGSPEFMAPERAKHTGGGLPADLWSLGVTLYTAVEGRSPFRRANTVATLTAVVADDPDPSERAGVLGPVLDGLLRKDPAVRIDADETRRLLGEAAAGAYGQASVAPPRPAHVPAQRIPPAGGAERTPRDSTAMPPERTAPDSTAMPPERTAPDSTAMPPERTPPDSIALPRERISPTGPSAPGSRRRTWVVALLVALAMAAGLGGWLAHRSGSSSATTAKPKPPASAQPAASDDATTTSTGSAGSGNGEIAPSTPAATSSTLPSAAPVTTPAGEPAQPAQSVQSVQSGQSGQTGQPGARPALPAGWQDYHDKTGFSVYVPAGWTRSKEGSIVYFRSGGRVLGIDQSRHPKPNPVADWQGQSAYRVKRGDFPRYDEIRIAAVPYFRKAADWEFTFSDGSRRHVNNRGFIVSDSQAYGIYWATPDRDWTAARPDLQVVFDSFRPAVR